MPTIFIRILFFLFLVFMSIATKAQVLDEASFRAKSQAGLDQMYNLYFNEAEASFVALQAEYPDHPAPYFMRALNRWWQTYLSVTMPDYYGFIEDQLEIAQEKLDDLEDNPSYERELPFFAFMIHALDARTHSYRNEWWSAMGAARRIINPLEASLEQEGSHPEYAMVNGVYRYYVATYHKSYPIIRPVLSFFPDGDEERGLRDLEKASREGGIARTEAQFFLGTIYRDETHQPQKGLAVSQSLSQRYPRNTWFQNDYARALIQTENYVQAEQVLLSLSGKYEAQRQSENRNISSKYSRYPTYMMMRVYHNLGYLYMQNEKDYSKALLFFSKSNKMASLAGVEEDSYLPANQYYTGLCKDYLGQREDAIEAYEAVLDLEENEKYKADARARIKSPAKAK